jgi:hypothetical protein
LLADVREKRPSTRGCGAGPVHRQPFLDSSFTVRTAASAVQLWTKSAQRLFRPRNDHTI